VSNIDVQPSHRTLHRYLTMDVVQLMSYRLTRIHMDTRGQLNRVVILARKPTSQSCEFRTVGILLCMCYSFRARAYVGAQLFLIIAIITHPPLVEIPLDTLEKTYCESLCSSSCSSLRNTTVNMSQTMYDSALCPQRSQLLHPEQRKLLGPKLL
jgi:hypothetical protein